MGNQVEASDKHEGAGKREECGRRVLCEQDTGDRQGCVGGIENMKYGNVLGTDDITAAMLKCGGNVTSLMHPICRLTAGEGGVFLMAEHYLL